ncbi:MAG: winged helix DNA-binding protein, partial [Anaerolineales bacterium]|nr:winged helix DNA-binding protein [Anaerolineales bacterium]
MSEKKALSERQKNILSFIHEYVQDNTRPPTIREIGKAVDISSTSVVNYNLTKLKEKGFLDRTAEVSRGLR